MNYSNMAVDLFFGFWLPSVYVYFYPFFICHFKGWGGAGEGSSKFYINEIIILNCRWSLWLFLFYSFFGLCLSVSVRLAHFLYCVGNICDLRFWVGKRIHLAMTLLLVQSCRHVFFLSLPNSSDAHIYNTRSFCTAPSCSIKCD